MYGYHIFNDMNVLTNVDQKILRTLVLISIILKFSVV